MSAHTGTEQNDGPADKAEELLPWHATGTLSPEDARLVEEALARDPELALHMERILEEREAAIVSAEALGMPSSRAADRLFAAIEAEPARAAPRKPLSLVTWIGEALAALTPRTLGFIAGAAVLVLMIQGGALTSLLTGGASFQSASGGDVSAPGAYLLVAFEPEARAVQIGTLLQSVPGRIVDGPYPGGIFKVRIGEADMAEAARDAALGRFKQAAGLVRMAAPAR